MGSPLQGGSLRGPCDAGRPKCTTLGALAAKQSAVEVCGWLVAGDASLDLWKKKGEFIVYTYKNAWVGVE